MNRNDLSKVNSLDRNSSSIWRNNTAEVFSNTSGDEDDEEALKWAALEKLPTYSRIKKGILTVEDSGPTEIDI
ncbi:Pleiotropic drug resistance protein [Thalictrum thalictroides]|uniref:Pleiotropic drug resistance protein n=1 Tax=Thalictrum thalictroides TaxID=46969 RepID=A0A7J6W2J3_THATH|nr:Pleiotropic drug resistance protein [Thalictrum thalictroides]